MRYCLTSLGNFVPGRVLASSRSLCHGDVHPSEREADESEQPPPSSLLP